MLTIPRTGYFINWPFECKDIYYTRLQQTYTRADFAQNRAFPGNNCAGQPVC